MHTPKDPLKEREAAAGTNRFAAYEETVARILTRGGDSTPTSKS